MKLSGKIVAKELKEFGKGKDAESQEVGVVTVKLDGAFRGKLTYQPGDDFGEIELGDRAEIQITFAQQKLDLNKRASTRRQSAEAH